MLMKDEHQSLPYRNNVSLVTFKDNKFLLVSLKSWDGNWWKFPQGGIKSEEEVIDAGKREFLEEIGTSKFRIIGQSKYTKVYDWPDFLIEERKVWRGQEQSFLLVEFLGVDQDINLGADEIRDYKWVSKEEIIKFSQENNHMLFHNYNGVILKILEEFKEHFN